MQLAHAPDASVQICQQNADSMLSMALAIPALAACFALAWLSRSPTQEELAGGRFFTDPDTGTTFEAEANCTAERDRWGELAWKAVSYTPFPVEVGCQGERVRVDVGPVDSRKPRTFVFEKKLRQPSTVFAVTLPRPMGVIVEEDTRRKWVVVANVVEKSRAGQRVKLAKFDRTKNAEAVLPGDVLRGCTCTTLVYPTKSLLFGKPPQRHVLMYGADGERWEKVATALKRGLVEDGPVTLVLERELDAQWCD